MGLRKHHYEQGDVHSDEHHKEVMLYHILSQGGDRIPVELFQILEDDAVKGQEEKGTTEDEMVGWHHRLNGHEFE